MVAGLKRDINTILTAQKALPDTPVIHRNLADMTKVLNRFVYQKGGWVLHMLRGRLGDERFWAGIREYYQRYQNQNVSTDDFRRVMEQVSGTDLEWFFTQWLTRSGIPRLEGTWRFDAAARQVTVTLTQSGMAAPARLPIEIGVTTTAGTPPRIEKVELIDRTGTFTFAADTEPAAVTLDPNTWLLFEAGPFTKPG
jgi:aminopeptidase N